RDRHARLAGVAVIADPQRQHVRAPLRSTAIRAILRHKRKGGMMMHRDRERAPVTRGLPLWFPIFGSHVRRLGLVRTALGAGPRSIGIPMFVALHVGTAAYALHFIVAPSLGLETIRARNYIILDRYKVRGLSAFDKFNCLFCGYANGLCTLLSARLDQLGAVDA